MEHGSKGVIPSQGVSFTFVIDSRHKIAASSSGAINRKMLEEMTSWAVKPSKKTADR
ncbi:hypothetical protein [Streptomyces cucumeris]|uniref:hypothetical protein n=1 Tax=Streptomyces cucumeris TaxID=2962890 RepID=UPI0020C91325|nr:hypothetical protein [Streptomyces sp. NEAU-Y11]MCP9208608.1 hypothetical protein [Streptomyces sp. NEAU-Y11]